MDGQESVRLRDAGGFRPVSYTHLDVYKRQLQDGFNKDINTRKARGEMGKNDVFLLRCPSSPVIIAECGFLSNSEDLHNLKKRGYQEQIVKILHKSIRSYLQQKSRSKAQ